MCTYTRVRVCVCVRKSSFGNNLPRLFSIHLCKNGFTTAGDFGPISLVRGIYRGGLRCEFLILTSFSKRAAVKVNTTTLLRVFSLVYYYNATVVSTRRVIIKRILKYRSANLSLSPYLHKYHFIQQVSNKLIFYKFNYLQKKFVHSAQTKFQLIQFYFTNPNIKKNFSL